MSDWIDLQLAHSLTRVQAPDELWARLTGKAAPLRKRPVAVRWAVPAGIAACVMALTAMPQDPQYARVQFASTAVERKLAHEPRVQPSSPARFKSLETSCKTCHNL